jgi:hypothetical protein
MIFDDYENELIAKAQVIRTYTELIVNKLNGVECFEKSSNKYAFARLLINAAYEKSRDEVFVYTIINEVINKLFVFTSIETLIAYLLALVKKRANDKEFESELSIDDFKTI